MVFDARVPRALIRCAVCAAAVVFSSLALANTAEINVRSQFIGQDTYVVAYPADRGNSPLEPGIYGLHRGSDKPTLLVKGKVLGAGRGFNGVLGQFELTHATERNEAMAIVNNQLVIFSSKSRPTKSDSIIVIGGKSTPLVDVMSRRPVPLDQITSIDDVAVFTHDFVHGHNYQLFLVSIKQKNGFGPGITFAALLWKGDSDSPSKLELVNAPVVIDYDFYTAKELARLVSRENFDEVISPSHLHALAEEMPSDDRILSEWRKEVGKVYRSLRVERKANTAKSEYSDIPHIPYYALFESKLSFREIPSAVLLEKPLAIVQRISPTGEGSGVLAGENRAALVAAKSASPTMYGRVDYDQTKGSYRVFPITSNDSQAALAVVDGKANLFLKTLKAQIGHVNVGAVIEGDIRNMSAYLTQVEGSRNDVHYYFLISRATRDNGTQTDLVVVEDKDGILRFERSLTLNRRFMSEKELQNRTHVRELVKADMRAEVLFDTVTSTEKILSGRLQRDSISTPMLNLSRSHVNHMAQTYLMAIETSDLIEGQVQYRKYNSEGATSVQSGFYIADTSLVSSSGQELGDYSRDAAYFVPAELLRVGGKSGASPILDTKALAEVKLPDKSTAPQFKVSAIAFNPDPGKKPNNAKFSVLVHVGSADHNSQVKAAVRQIEIPADFSRLVGAKIIQGRRARGLNVTILFFFKGAQGKASTGREKGGIYAVNMDLSSNIMADSKARIGNMAAQWVERDEVTPTAIKHRLVHDTPGDAHWIVTPDKERHDRHYAVRKFAMTEDKLLYPNRPGERILLRYNEPAEDEDYGSLFRSQSRWLVYTEQDLTDRYSWFKDHIKEVEKQLAGPKQKRQAAMFPQLDRFLEERAQERGNKAHEILLVEPQMKDFILRHMITRLVAGDKSKWSLQEQKFNFYVLDNTANEKETRDELDKISRAQGGRQLLFTDLAEILHADGVEVTEAVHTSSNDANDDEEGDQQEEASDNQPSGPAKFPFNTQNKAAAEAQEAHDSHHENDSHDDDGDDSHFTTSRLMVLATEGDRVPLREFKAHSQMANHIPMLMLATPAEWRAMANHYEDEAAAGVFASYKVNAQFLTSSWSVWAPPTGKATKEIISVAKSPVSKDEYNVFPNLERMLNEAATLGHQSEHRLIIIPDELKPLVRRLVLSRWATDSKVLQGPWNHSNFDLALFQVSAEKEITQEMVHDNFEAMHGAIPTRRPVLLGDMGEILKIGRPHSVDQNGGFLLKDPAAGKNPTTGLASDPSSSGAVTTKQFPHLMWWLASEGKAIQPKKTQGWSISEEVKPQVPMLIFASERELAQLETDAAFEERFVDFKKQFKIERLEVPSSDTKIRLVEELFNRPEIAGLNYEFKHNDLGPVDARRQLIGLMVGRIEQVARMQKQEPTSAFLRTYTELRRTLTEDTRLRQERKIDRFFFERLYRRVFPMPLNFDILTHDDPLRKLEDIDKAAIGLQEKGYEGSTDLKKKVIETVVSQTRGSDDGRPIPSSTILYGSTSTGKTFLFKTLINYMGLKVYDFDKPADDGAGAIIINAGTLVEEDDPSNHSRMSVDKAIAHLENFLSLPNGSRGFVLFDDLHKGTGKVRQKLLAFIQTFFESPMMRVRRMNEAKDVHDIPVRNLNLYMTLNPQPDRDVLGRYVDETSEEDIDKHIIAALAGDDVQIDESFIARWATKVNLDKFPREAKLPSLVSRIRNATQQEFSGRPRLMLVTPPVLSKLVEKFPNANAREFLSTATYGILGLDNDMQAAPIYIVQPNRERWRDQGGGIGEFRDVDVDSTSIRNVLKGATVVRPVRGNDISSQVDLLSFLLDGFRAHVYHSLITAAQRSPTMVGSKEVRQTELAAFLLGTLHNFVEYPEVPLTHVRLRPDELGSNKDRHLVEFNDAVKRHSEKENSFFRFRFHSETNRHSVSLDQFLSPSQTAPPKRGRIDVMAETAGQIQLILRDLMAAYFRLKSVDASLDVNEWASRLTEAEPRLDFRDASEKIVKLFFDFSKQLTDSELMEMASLKYGAQEILDYDRVRLFLMCVDKAMTQLPWGRVSHFLFDVVDTAVKDLSFGLRPELQHLLFSSLYSPLTTMTPEAVEQIAFSSKDLRDFAEQKGERLHARFDRECENLLIPKGEK